MAMVMTMVMSTMMISMITMRPVRHFSAHTLHLRSWCLVEIPRSCRGTVDRILALVSLCSP
eukprot:12401513-Karenia_brevis.AAC.1